MHGSFSSHQKCIQEWHINNGKLHSRLDRVDQNAGMQKKCELFQKELTNNLQLSYNVLGGKQYVLARKETRA